MTQETKFCHHCGAEIDIEAVTCPGCGLLQQGKTLPTKREKNPDLAAGLSFFFTGFGQIYNGDVAKGIGIIVLQLIGVCLFAVGIGFVTFFIVWVYSVYDAHTTAKKINAEEK